MRLGRYYLAYIVYRKMRRMIDIARIVPVILSGGSGSRLWPLSRKLLPKQFLPLSDSDHSLFQETILRLKELNTQPPLVICNDDHRFMVAEHLREIDEQKGRIVLEPEGKNTAPAVALAAHLIEDKNDIMAVLPSDHQIKDPAAFREGLLTAANFAAKDFLVTFGVIPNKPETGYGYIKAGAEIEDSKVFNVQQFVEKPDSETAEKFLEEGHYYWNSGMFVFTAKAFLKELKAYAPDIYQQTKLAAESKSTDLDFVRVDAATFAACPADSIDYAVMEHTKSAVVVPTACEWTDLGSWASMWDAHEKDANGNAFIGDVLSADTKNSIVHSQNRLVVTVGMDNCVVVDTQDAVLVAHKDDAQKVKDIVNTLTEGQRSEVEYHQRVYRPWGYYENLIESDLYKVKRIMVHPGASLSLQLHHQRAEHWVVVKGTAEVTNGDDVLTLTENQSTYIPVETKHRLRNTSTEALFLIEVQCGDYLGEDDIVRYEDTYGRVS